MPDRKEGPWLLSIAAALVAWADQHPPAQAGQTYQITIEKRDPPTQGAADEGGVILGRVTEYRVVS